MTCIAKTLGVGFKMKYIKTHLILCIALLSLSACSHHKKHDHGEKMIAEEIANIFKSLKP